MATTYNILETLPFEVILLPLKKSLRNLLLIIQWNNENIGERYLQWDYVGEFDNIAYRFKTEEDVMAFKLRWI